MQTDRLLHWGSGRCGSDGPESCWTLSEEKDTHSYTRMLCLGKKTTIISKQIQINSAGDVEFLSKAEEYGIQDARGRGGHPRQ